MNPPNPRGEPPRDLTRRGSVSTAPSPKAWMTHGALLVVQLAFASQPVEAKLAMRPVELGGEGVPPSAIAMMRMVGAALFFQWLWRATGRMPPRSQAPALDGTRVPLVLSWRDHRQLALLSLGGIVLNQALYLWGLRSTGALPAALLSVTIPVMTAALAIAFRKEAPNARTFAGLAVAVAGVLWLTGVRHVDRGVLILVGNSLFYSAYVVFSRDVIQRLGSVTVVTWIFTWGAVLFAPFGVGAVVANAASWTPRAWGLIAFIVVVPTIVAYLAHAWALARSSPSVATVYVCIQPLITALLAWLQFGDGLTARMAQAGALIVLGVGIVATRPGARRPPRIERNREIPGKNGSIDANAAE